jgi:mRNA interferase YafQ
MRTIEWTGQFKRDYKREAKGKYRAALDVELSSVVNSLANDQALDSRYRDHGLVGNWKDHRDCHIKPDLILIYRLQEVKALQLVRLGSHSELGI